MLAQLPTDAEEMKLLVKMSLHLKVSFTKKVTEFENVNERVLNVFEKVSVKNFHVEVKV